MLTVNREEMHTSEILVRTLAREDDWLMCFPADREELKFVTNRERIADLGGLDQFTDIVLDRLFAYPAVNPREPQFLGQFVTSGYIERIVRSAGVAGDLSGVFLG